MFPSDITSLFLFTNSPGLVLVRANFITHLSAFLTIPRQFTSSNSVYEIFGTFPKAPIIDTIRTFMLFFFGSRAQSWVFFSSIIILSNQLNLVVFTGDQVTTNLFNSLFIIFFSSQANFRLDLDLDLASFLPWFSIHPNFSFLKLLQNCQNLSVQFPDLSFIIFLTSTLLFSFTLEQ